MNTGPARRSTEQISTTAADWVARRAAGLSSEDEAALSRWLAADALHQSAFAYHSDAFAAFDRPRITGRVPQFVQEIETRVKRRRRRMIQSTAAGFGLVLLVAAGWRSSWEVQPTPARDNAIVHKPEIRRLPDGSFVELKLGAELSVDFSASFRRVTLRKGGGHFQVAHDPSRPFVVTAAGIETRAVGTAFSVQLENDEVEVIVTHGRVTVERSEATSPPPSPELARLAYVDAGRRLVVSIADGVIPPATAALPPDELAERLAWRRPRLEFTDTPLAEAVALMNREARGSPASPARRLVIAATSKELATEPVSGLFRADKTEAFVRMLEITLGLQVEERPDEIVLHRRR